MILAGCIKQDVLRVQEGLGEDLELLYVGCLQVDIPIEDQEVRDCIPFRMAVSVGQYHDNRWIFRRRYDRKLPLVLTLILSTQQKTFLTMHEDQEMAARFDRFACPRSCPAFSGPERSPMLNRKRCSKIAWGTIDRMGFQSNLL